jgi:DNA-binding MarR family transcriptional regulator
MHGCVRGAFSHRTGWALSQMEKSGITLPQVLLLTRVEHAGTASISELANVSPGSAAAMSQMVDRLVRQNWLARCEDPADRRRKAVSITSAGARLLRDLERENVGLCGRPLAASRHLARRTSRMGATRFGRIATRRIAMTALRLLLGVFVLSVYGTGQVWLVQLSSYPPLAARR